MYSLLMPKFITRNMLNKFYARLGYYAAQSRNSFLKIGSIGCTETSVRNYQPTLCNIPDDGTVHLHGDGILKTPTLE